MPAFPMNKAPQGLIELLRMRNLGQMPPWFSDVVQGVVDMTEFYAGPNKAVSASAPTVGSIAGAGLTETFLLSGPVRIHAMSAQLTVGAAPATNVALSVGITDVAAGGFQVLLGNEFYAAVNATAAVGVSGIPSSPFVLPAGFQLTAYCTGTAAGADHSLACRMLIDIITGGV